MEAGPALIGLREALKKAGSACSVTPTRTRILHHYELLGTDVYRPSKIVAVREVAHDILKNINKELPTWQSSMERVS